MKMHDRKDENVALFATVKYSERKTMRQAAPDIGLNFSPQGRIGMGVLDCGVDFVRNFTENGQVKQSKTATFRSEATLDLFVCP